MKAPWNPSTDEIRRWAYARPVVEPEQDWDLALSTARHDKIYLELATDADCPARQYLLRVLYLIVGDAVRSSFRSAARNDIEELIARGDGYDHAAIREWQERSRDLLAHPDNFEYSAWCAGGLASTSGPPNER